MHSDVQFVNTCTILVFVTKYLRIFEYKFGKNCLDNNNLRLRIHLVQCSVSQIVVHNFQERSCCCFNVGVCVCVCEPSVPSPQLFFLFLNLLEWGVYIAYIVSPGTSLEQRTADLFSWQGNQVIILYLYMLQIL